MNSTDVVGYFLSGFVIDGYVCTTCVKKYPRDNDENPAVLADNVTDEVCAECDEYLVAPDPYTYTNDTIERALKAYLGCARWVSETEKVEGEWDETNLSTTKKEVAEFWISCHTLLKDWSPEEWGWDFFLTRNGEGEGFWSHGKENGQLLTELAASYGTADVIVDDDTLYIF